MKFSDVVEKVITIREQKVILDSDVAWLYGVETKRINEAVSNNPEKFPSGYVMELQSDEWKILKSKFSTSTWGGKNKLPKAFTRKGCYMLATILKSPKATDTTIAIIEAFDKLNELRETVAELSQAPEEFKQKTLMQKGGEVIAELLGDNLKTSEEETCFEINFAVLKFRHSVKRKA